MHKHTKYVFVDLVKRNVFQCQCKTLNTWLLSAVWYIYWGGIQCAVVDGATVAREEEVQENSARVGFFRLLLLEISTADIFEVYTEKMNFPGGLVSENLQFYWNMWNMRMREPAWVRTCLSCAAYQLLLIHNKSESTCVQWIVKWIRFWLTWGPGWDLEL